MRFQKLAELWVILARRNCLGKTCQAPARCAPISARAGKAVRSEWWLSRRCQEAWAGAVARGKGLGQAIFFPARKILASGGHQSKALERGLRLFRLLLG